MDGLTRQSWSYLANIMVTHGPDPSTLNPANNYITPLSGSDPYRRRCLCGKMLHAFPCDWASVNDGES